MRIPNRFLGLGAALIAGTFLLAGPATYHPPTSAPAPASVAWPKAQGSTFQGTLADGSTYEPLAFLDAKTSVGTAPTRDAKTVRLVLRGTDGSIRALRLLPADRKPSFRDVTADGKVLVWAEQVTGQHLALWTMDLRDARPARLLTADTGDAAFYDSQYDLLIRDGRVHWTARAGGVAEATELRSVALTGGPVEVRTRPGTWQFSTWPWLVDGAFSPDGTTTLHNLDTNRDLAVPRKRRDTPRCGPTWCRVLSLAGDGSTHIDLMHPDGTARQRIGGDTAHSPLGDVGLLDRFEVVSLIGTTADVTGTMQLLVFDLATRRPVQVSLGARTVAYRGGMLWWSTGDQSVAVWHSIDLRTV
jgi:hypothetical protein